MVALTRIADEPILERGMIAVPDLVVVADETLLDDAQARPLQGLTAAGRVLINAKSTPDALRERDGLASGLAILDGTELALTHVGSMAGLSVALGAATCKLVGLSPAHVPSCGAELAEIGHAEIHAVVTQSGVEICLMRAGGVGPDGNFHWPLHAGRQVTTDVPRTRRSGDTELAADLGVTWTASS